MLDNVGSHILLPDNRIVYLPIDEVKPSIWNPPQRISPENLSRLVRSMQEEGFWPHQPLILGREKELADGHRRLAAAKIAEIPHVPTLQVDMSASVLWAEINGMREPIKPAQSLIAKTRGAIDIPEQHRYMVDQFIAVVGEDEARADYMQGVSPRILSIARKVARYVGMTEGAGDLRSIVIWLRKNQMTYATRVALEWEIDPKIIRAFIESNQPLPRFKLDT